MKILVTGSNGLLGRALLRSLPDDSEITAVVHHARTADLPADSTIIEADLAEPEFIDHSWPDSIDAVVHLAYAPATADPESQQVAFAVNTRATLDLIQYAIKAGASNFVLASSGSVYPSSERHISEEDETDSIDYYGATKLAAEIIAQGFSDKIDVQVLRLFNLYGPGARHGLISQIATRIASGQDVTVAGRTGIRTTPTFVDDAATVLRKSLELSGSHTINVAGPETIDVHGLAMLIGQITNRTPKFEFIDSEVAVSRMGKSVRSDQLINYSPATTLDTGLKRTLEST